MAEVFESRASDGLFVLRGLDLQLIHKLDTRLQLAVDVVSPRIIGQVEGLISGVTKASGFRQLSPDALKLLDDIRKAASSPDTQDDEKARKMSQLCLRIYGAEKLFGKLYATVNEKLRSWTRFVGIEPKAILQAMESTCGELYPFIRFTWMGLKTTLKIGGDQKTLCYRGTRISDAALGAFETAAQEGGHVMLSEFLSFNVDEDEATKSARKKDERVGTVIVLFEVESVGRTPIRGESAGNKRVLWPPCQIYRVVRMTKSDEHGRPRVTRG
jgi:hypothetical protein